MSKYIKVVMSNGLITYLRKKKIRYFFQDPNVNTYTKVRLGTNDYSTFKLTVEEFRDLLEGKT